MDPDDTNVYITILAWNCMRLHVYMPAHEQIDLGEQKLACLDR